jgi:hypothetical protein
VAAAGLGGDGLRLVARDGRETPAAIGSGSDGTLDRRP